MPSVYPQPSEHPKVFVSHVTEDKEPFVIPCATKRRARGIDVMRRSGIVLIALALSAVGLLPPASFASPPSTPRLANGAPL